MSDSFFRPNDETISLKHAWAIYFFVLIAFGLLSNLFILIQAGGISILLYIGGGIYLNRWVLRKIIIWHPIYDTVENVYKGKLQMFAFWPISYPILLIKLAVVKHL